MSNCNLCSGKLLKKFSAKDRLNLTPKNFWWCKCDKCGLIQLPEVKDNEYFKEYYFKEKDSLLDKVIYLNRLRIFKKFINKKSKILEIGCGSGRFLNFLKEKGFNELYGIEYSDKSLKYMERFSFRKGKKIPSEKFDLILMEASLEHVENPKEILNQVEKALSKKGILIITIPNIESLQSIQTKKYWFHLDTPRHLFMFTRNTLSKYLRNINLIISKEIHFNLSYDLPGWFYSKKRKPVYKFWHNIISLVYLPLLLYTTITKQSSVVTYLIKRANF